MRLILPNKTCCVVFYYCPSKPFCIMGVYAAQTTTLGQLGTISKGILQGLSRLLKTNDKVS